MVAEPVGIDTYQKEVALTGKMLSGGLDDLRGH